MGLRLKFFSFACLLAVSIFVLMGCTHKTTQPPSSPTVKGMESATDRTDWNMVWVDDFGIDELPHKDLTPHLESYVRSVKIQTAVIDGQVFTMRAFAGCNRMGREVRRRVKTPAKTIEKSVDGKVEYETVPAVLDPYVEVLATQKACSIHHHLEGQKYDLNWISPMEEFLLTNFQTRNLRKGDILEWVNLEGIVIAKFETAL